MDKTTSSAINMHALLSGEQVYQMPLFQRRYEWRETPELNRLWEDIEKLLDQRTDAVFLGAIVLQIESAGDSANSKKYTVIDGQQRITTFFTIICALIVVAQKFGWNGRAKDLCKQYVLSALSSEEGKPKLLPTIPDNTEFNSIISQIDNPEPTLLPEFPTEDGFLLESFNYSVAKIEAYLDDFEGEEQKNTFESIVKTITEKMEIVQIALTKQHDANEVFDRLNTGGRNLRVVDLVRNELFQTVSKDYNKAWNLYTSKWRPFELSFSESLSDLSADQIEKLIDGFFFPYVLACRSGATKNRILQELRALWKKVGTPDGDKQPSAGLIIDHMKSFLPAYLALAQNVRPANLSDEAWSALLRLNAVPLPSVTYPFMMNVIQSTTSGKTNPGQFETICHTIESFLVRRGVVGLEPTGLHAIFKKLWETAGDDLTKVAENIESGTIRFPDDVEFRKGVLAEKLYKKKVCKFVVSEYEAHLQNKSIESLKYLPDITIDHVVPQTLTAGWAKEFSAEDHEKLLHTWGNLVPLSSPANSTKGTKSYEEACAALKHETKFMTAQELMKNYDSWGATEIEQRSKDLAEWAISRWQKA